MISKRRWRRFVVLQLNDLQFGVISEKVDEAFSAMDGDIQDLVDEETDKVLFEVAQMHLAGI